MIPLEKGVTTAIVAAVLSVPLIASSLIHLASPYAFLASVLSYGLIGGWMAVTVAAVLPIYQMAAGAALIGNPYDHRHWVLVAVPYAIFAFVQWHAIATGNAIACGCFGQGGETISTTSASLVGSGAIVAAVWAGAAWVTARP